MKAPPPTDKTALQRALQQCRSGFIAVFVFSFFLNLLMLATPLYMLQIFERVISSGHLQTLFYLTVITLFALLILGVLNTLRSWILGRLSGWLSGALGGRVIAASLESSLAGSATGTQPLRDLGDIRTFIGGTGINALFDSPWVPVFVAAVWLMHPWLGALAAVSAVVLFVLALLNELLTRDPQHEATRRQSRAYTFADASLRNAEVVQAMGMLPNLVSRWVELNAGALDRHAVVNTRSATILGLSRFVRLSVQVGILGLGAMLVIQGELTPGQMIAASILLGRALAPVEQSIAAWRTFIAARGGYSRLQQLMQARPEVPAATTLPPPAGHIRVEKVTFTPPLAEKPVLHGISFSLAPGETLGVVGPSAAGKSTLCRLLVGVWPPTLGSVRLDSAAVHSWNREEFGNYVGYLPQDVELFAGTVRQNIARMGDATDDEVIEAAKLADVHEMVLHLPHGYDTQIGEGGANLSAGQRQRIGLARALFREPRVVVLDEPNSNLDRIGEAALVRTIKILRERGVTIVMVVHHANLLQTVDKLAVLREGRMDAFGPRNEVLAHINND